MSPVFAATVLSCGKTCRTEWVLARSWWPDQRWDSGKAATLPSTMIWSLVSSELVRLLSNCLKVVSSQESCIFQL